MKTDIKQLLDGIRLSQCGWEDSEDIMMFNGTPIGATISQNVEIDRWWPSLKEELSLLLAPAIEAAVAAAGKDERKRCRKEEVEPLIEALNHAISRLCAYEGIAQNQDLRDAVRAAQEQAGKEQG